MELTLLILKPRLNEQDSDSTWVPVRFSTANPHLSMNQTKGRLTS